VTVAFADADALPLVQVTV
jgi:hypothetical protein